jgi:hypothetical protein
VSDRTWFYAVVLGVCLQTHGVLFTGYTIEILVGLAIIFLRGVMWMMEELDD